MDRLERGEMKNIILAFGVLFLLLGSFVNNAGAIECELTASMPDENDKAKWVLYREREHDVTKSKYYKSTSTENKNALMGVHSYFNQIAKKVWGCADEEGRTIDQNVAVLKEGKWYIFHHASSPTIRKLTEENLVSEILIRIYDKTGNILDEILFSRPN